MTQDVSYEKAVLEAEQALLNETNNAENKLQSWHIHDIHYSEYEKFNKFFDSYDKSHLDKGNGKMCYREDFAYPTDIDPDLHFQEFIKKAVSELPLRIDRCTGTWGVEYKPGAYSNFHCHAGSSGIQPLSVVMFLTTAETNSTYPLAGDLVTMLPEDHRIISTNHKSIAGDVVIMEGKVFHGTYPTLNNRRVFVCDFDYTKI